MSPLLLAFVALIYGYVAADQALQGRGWMALVWAGYAVAQIGLVMVTRAGKLD